MAACERIELCPLMRQFTMKSSLRVWQSYYCEGNFSRCERWKLSTRGLPVPSNLLPNGRLLEVPMEQVEAKDFQ
jgi:hypothetical protein